MMVMDAGLDNREKDESRERKVSDEWETPHPKQRHQNRKLVIRLVRADAM